ncbi:MAG TPA: translation initiation factor IF-3 [Nannocystaceae bacterium]|nr:translation initiation factor IF-3 [Nannocystaceae bacterium]
MRRRSSPTREPRSTTISRRTSRPPPRPSEQHRVGRRIRAREVRVIDDAGEQRGIMTTQDAMELAATANLQLVEVNPKANPPVCKIMDYGKFKYETAKREREAKKNQKTFEVKEVKFRPKTHEHDFDFKLRHIRRFLGEGDKVRLVVQFRGREITHPETGRAILDRVCKGVVDLATVAQMAQLEGNRLNMVLAPKPNRLPVPARPKPPEPLEGRPPPRVVPPRVAKPEGDEDVGDDDDDDMEDDADRAAAADAAAEAEAKKAGN